MKPWRWLVVTGRAFGFLPFFLWELVLANAQVALEVVSPRNRMRPGIIRVPLKAERDLEIMLIANLISLTPGTLTLEVTDDRSALFVHGLHISTPDRFRARIAKMEQRLLKVMR